MTLLRPFTFFTLCAALLLGACSNPMNAPKLHIENDVPLAKLGDNVRPVHYDVSLRLDPKADGLSGLVLIDIEIEKPTQQIWLHGKSMTVTDAFAAQGETVIKAGYEAQSEEVAPAGVALLSFDTPLAAGKARLSLTYETPYNTSLFSAYKVARGEDAYIITQFEPMGAREAFPSFDEPRFKVPFDVSISSPAGNVVYANTPKMAQTEDSDGWITHTFSTTRPLPTYLLAFGAGPFDVVDYGMMAPNDIRSRPLALRGLAAKGSGDQLKYALENTAGILTALEGYFGQEYPYEKLDLIAAPDYAFGAMENPGAIVYREYLLLLDDDAPLSQKRAYAGVHSHELAHQWFGNLVTPVWWEDIWLNEAFATWMGNKGTSIWKPEGNYDFNTLKSALSAMKIDSLSTTRKVREPLERSENVMDQFDGITYRKGGGVLSMFESYVGEDEFRAGVRLHMERYADGVATGDDFFNSIADGSQNPDVVSAMKSFVDQPGLPLVSGKMSCDGFEHVVCQVNLTQSRYAPLGSTIEQGQSWEIPVCGHFGYAEDIVTQCVLMKDKTATLNAVKHGKPEWVMLNADAAGYYRFTLDSAGWTYLLANVDALSTREQLATLDSLKAAFAAGEVETGVYIQGLKTFGKLTHYDVASSAASGLASLDDLVTDSSSADLAGLTQAMFADRYVAIKNADTAEGKLLTPTLAALLTGMGQSAELRAEFTKKGAAYLGLDGKANTTSVSTNLLTQGLRETMRARPHAAASPLLALVKSGSAVEKRSAISALGAGDDKALAATLREAALSDTGAMTGRQAASLISAMMGNDDLRDETWEWLKANFDDFVNTRVADVRKSRMPGFAQFCSGERRDEVEAFFNAKADLIPGYQRSLKQTLESIELCVALKEAKSAELESALATR